jgi:dihydrodipicolinate synthase/N-acetylneuraminate lyase
MAADALRGVVPILVTPFDQQSQIDEDSLRRLVEFSLEAGVHGLGVALGSEVFKLSEAEREQVTRIVVSQVRRRVPVVINTGAPGTDLAVAYSRAAERAGADALMAMPPAFTPAGAVEMREYYRALSDAVGIPIFIQDTAGAPVSAGLACQIADECERVRFIKVECPPVLPKVAEAVASAGDRLVVFGGFGGNYLLGELARGSQGTMPSCSQPEAFVKVWDHFRSGDVHAARAEFERAILPVNRIVDQGPGLFYNVHKEILRQRGVIRSARVRRPSPPVDDQTCRELQDVIDALYPGRTP